MNIEEFKERYEELKNNPMYQKYCSVLETKDKIIKKLQQENQQLKKDYNKLATHLYNEQHKRIELKDRIDKALEFIEENCW